jgi:hypothetical protein
MDPDWETDPAIFVINLRDANKKLTLKKSFSYYFLKVHLHHFPKMKSPKEVRNSRYQGSDYFLLDDGRMIEGSGSGSIPLTNGSGLFFQLLIF